MGNKTRNIIFQQQKKTRKTGKKNGGKKGKKHQKNRKKNENYKNYRNKISTRYQKMLKTETIFWRDFVKYWKQQQEQKWDLLERHDTTIREQKRGLGAGLHSRHVSDNKKNCFIITITLVKTILIILTLVDTFLMSDMNPPESPPLLVAPPPPAAGVAAAAASPPPPPAQNLFSTGQEMV